MSEIKELLHKDREAGIPDLPDVRYTTAALRQRLRQVKPIEREPIGLAVVIAILLVGGLTAGLWLLGLDLRWMLLLLLPAFASLPLLIQKGAPH